MIRHALSQGCQDVAPGGDPLGPAVWYHRVMNEDQKTRISKFLSLVLRHEPGKIGLTLDAAGWADVDDLLAKLHSHGRSLSRTDLEEVVATNEKKRYAFSEDGRRIRASQGHSIDVQLGYTQKAPPDRLFHGTATRFVDSIKASGLIKGERHHVHLSADAETARKVGQRHGKPVILIVLSVEMQKAGHVFYQSDNGVWLVEHVPSGFLEFPGNA